MNALTIGLPERSWASAGYAADYARGVANYKRSIWRMLFLEGVLAPGATTIFPVYRFPRAVHVINVIGITRGATAAELAALEFGISDVSDRPRDQAGSGQIVTDGRFSGTAPVLTIVGPQFEWFPVDRWQPHNSQWIWTLTNTGAGEISPIFLLEVESAFEGQIAAVHP